MRNCLPLRYVVEADQVFLVYSGGPLEKGLRRVVLDARLGSLLINVHATTPAASRPLADSALWFFLE